MVILKNRQLIKEGVLCNDHPTKYAHLGWRFIISFLSWILLGMNISEGRSFFTSLAIFILPLLVDYYRYEPIGKLRKLMTDIAKGVNWLFMIVACLGLFGVVGISDVEGTLCLVTAGDFVYSNFCIVSIRTFWWLLIISVFICCVDWCVNKTPLEQKDVCVEGLREEDFCD